MVVFAATAGSSSQQIRIRWPDGSRSVLQEVPSGQIYEIRESDIAKLPPEAVPPTAPMALFEDASHLLAHTHHEDPFNDLTIQPMLPVKLSQQGPAVAFVDMEHNGEDALIIASGEGGAAGRFAWHLATETFQNQPGDLGSITIVGECC